MKSHKQVWIAALCLLSAIAIALAFTLRTTKVQAAKHIAPKSPTSLAQPAVYLASPALRNAMLLDSSAPHVDGTLQRNNRLVLPPVEGFTLTPPDPKRGITKTTIAVHFSGNQVENLPSQFPILLGRQHVVFERSESDPNTFVTQVDFDWQTFAKEQGQRKEAASNGKMVPVFEGRRFIRMEPMQFVDPEQILGALQSHQPLQFSQQVLNDGPANVVPDHELMITAIPVVEDPSNTFDPCNPSSLQNSNGPWTFNILMQEIACSGGNCTPQTPAGQQMAENMLMDMFLAWQNTNLQVNNFPVPTRTGIGTLGQTGFLANWPVDRSSTCSNGPGGLCPSLPNAPVHLDAIVNRIDLGQFSTSPTSNAGELRFVFGVTTNKGSGSGVCVNQGQQPFNIILEYNVPSSFSAPEWASAWNSLPTTDFGQDYLGPLKTTITDAVVTPNACNGASCLAAIRTNEIVLGPSQDLNPAFWEMRQFALVQNNGPQLEEMPVSMTPGFTFNFGQPNCGSQQNGFLNFLPCNPNGDLQSWINTNQAQILASGGALPNVPDQFNGTSFLGGSAFNLGNSFWVDQNQTNSETARVDFSANTCNGCHGAETSVTDFQQVHNRQATGGQNDAASVLSNFLLGCVPSPPASCGQGNPGQENNGTCSLGRCGINTPGQVSVTDPNDSSIRTSFGDILRRQNYMESLLSNQPLSGGMLLPLIKQPIGVH